MTEKMITLLTPKDCINQIIEGYATVQRGYGLADEAMIAYLQMDGCTIQTLYDDLQKAGCDIAKKTLQNRQSILRGEGKLPPANARYRRDGNGAIPESGMGKGASLTDIYDTINKWTEQVWGDTFDGHPLDVGLSPASITVNRTVEITKPNTLSALVPTLVAFNAWVTASDEVHNAVILIANSAVDDGVVTQSQMEMVRQMILPR